MLELSILYSVGMMVFIKSGRVDFMLMVVSASAASQSILTVLDSN